MTIYESSLPQIPEGQNVQNFHLGRVDLFCEIGTVVGQYYLHSLRQSNLVKVLNAAKKRAVAKEDYIAIYVTSRSTTR